jgi:hypothetical protein
VLPITILAAQKFADILVEEDALQEAILTLGKACDVSAPLIPVSQILVTSVGADLADRNGRFSYPRILLYCDGLKNSQIEKFRSISGSVSVVVEIHSSSNLLEDVERWIHFYVEALTGILRRRAGDWGDGIFYTGIYEVVLSTPKTGGLGFVKTSKISFSLNVSRS